jgi:hypothetical protein
MPAHVYRVILTCAGWSVMAAHAQCPAADALIRDYGISFAGFDKSLPRTTDPQEAVKGEEVVRIPLWNKKGTVADGFEHIAVISKRQQRAWILRTGGFVGVREWYGPVPVREFDVGACLAHRTEPAPAR